jgi:hypothetical protein
MDWILRNTGWFNRIGVNRYEEVLRKMHSALRCRSLDGWCFVL